MVALPSKFVGTVLAPLAVSTAAQAQSYYDDQACRQFADAQVAPCATKPIPRRSGTPSLALVLVRRSVRGWRRSGRWDRNLRSRPDRTRLF
jgi:hypothetical protein